MAYGGLGVLRSPGKLSWPQACICVHQVLWSFNIKIKGYRLQRPRKNNQTREKLEFALADQLVCNFVCADIQDELINSREENRHLVKS